MIASPSFPKLCLRALTVLLALFVTTSSGLVAGELNFRAIESGNVPILKPVESPNKKAIGSSTSSIKIVIPASWSEEQPQPSKPAAVEQGEALPKVHLAQPIEVQARPAAQEEVGPTGVAPDQSLRAIRLLSALSDEWGRPVPKAPSPFKEEPVETAPKPKQPQTEPAKPVTPKPEEVPPKEPTRLPEPRQTPAPIESGPAPIETPEPVVKPLQPSDVFNDDLPYYDYDQSSQSRPCRIPGNRLRDRLFRGHSRQMATPCPGGQCPTAAYPAGDPWGPGHWVGPGIWVPDRAAQPAVPMYDDPDYYGAIPDDGVYGWGPPRRFIEPAFLARRGITLGGWIDQGITYNASDPADRYNGPVTFNDRSGDYQMNQLDVFLERKVDGSESGLEIGGRVDTLFGTDARFTEAVGWETNWDMTERFYRLSVPQMYADFGLRKWTVRMGHFYSGFGYESVPAVNNFFYSHSYSMQYGEPFTFTGMQATRRITSQLKVNAGFHRGWNQFNGIDDCNQLSVLAGANWVSRGGRLKFDFALTAGPRAPGNSTVMYSMVGTYIPRGWLELVVQHDYGQSTGGDLYGVRFAEWYSIIQYAFVNLNERWKVGARVECFCDKQGVLVHGLGNGNLATGPYPGDFWEVTVGLNWEPRRNIRIRPEARWDWYSQTGTTVNRPFDGGNSSNQFLLGVDAIVQF